MPPIFCPTCATLILDAASCAACGWQRPLAAGSAGQELWRAELSHALPKPQAAAAIAGEHLCLSAEDGTLAALALDGGQRAWERQVEGGQAAHSLAAHGARLLVSSADLRPLPVAGRPLLALDARTGTELWRYPTAGHSLSRAAVADHIAYLSSSDGRLHAVDCANGQPRWIAAHTAWGPGAPAVDAGVVCAGGRSNTLIGYAASDGAELWRFTAGGWFASDLLAAQQRIYAACWDGHLYALDTQSGRLLWEFKGERGQGITSLPAFDSGRIFVGSRVYLDPAKQQGNGYALLALRAEDGAELWRYATAKHIFAPPAIAGDCVVFGADEDCLALDAATGALRWAIDLNARMVTQPQVAGEQVYLADRQGAVRALRWRDQPAEQVSAPQSYLRSGAIEQAVQAYALRGEYAAAAELCEQRLEQPREAAQLYERAAQPQQAARLWAGLGELRRARELYQQAGDQRGVAQIHERMGEPLQAARLYADVGELAAAARLYEQAGDRLKAADLYHSAGQLESAGAIWRSLNQWERLADALVAEGKLAEAAQLLEQHEQRERAAELYETAGQRQPALSLRIQLGHWEHVVALAAPLDDDAQLAQAHEQLGNALAAGEAYERLASRASASTPPQEEQAATYYERAAALYDTAYEEQRAEQCRRQLRRYRRLPEIAVAGGAQQAFVEYEWNSLKLRIRNSGYGPATDISTTLSGAFDIQGNRAIASLAPKKSTPLEIAVRPQRDQYGPAVPLDISISYSDRQGGKYTVRRVIYIRVTQQGSAPNTTTPVEILISSDRLPRSAARGATLAREPAAPLPASAEEIEQQQTLLATHRRTLAHLIRQAALHGGEAFAPTPLASGLYEARKEIQRCKQTLRAWGIAIADQVGDLPAGPGA